MYYILFYKTVDNYIERRTPFREDHLGLVQELENQLGVLLIVEIGQDDGEQVVEVVRNRSGELAHHLHLLGLDELGSPGLALGDVREGDDRTDHRPVS